MPKKARAILARTQNLPGQTNKGSKPLSDTVDDSDLQMATIASQAKKPDGNVGGKNKRARIEEIFDEDNLPKRSTTCVHLAAREDTSTTEETGNLPIPRYIPPQLDPDLIEIIGRFEMMDEDPSDGLAPEPPEDMRSDDEDEADETEIQDLTNESNRKRFRDLQAKGFASVANFFSHVRDTISKRPRTEETTVDSHTERPREEAESSRMTAREAGMRSEEGTCVDEGEEEESSDESENGDSLPAEHTH
ncbi:hypothetical protein B0H14DRAFT_2557430 [Mycena olivaceomarginata]|nr:hypothetical protein B0H14DRAFT_2557430 [Mycena olivaceomarginata]